jgi:AcrR family transcriptional regulator
MGLRQADIVEAAMVLADERGADALTMKAVAERLGPYTAMALYRHVRGKDELVDLMLDAAIATVPVPAEPGPDWRADLTAIARRTRQMIKEHPWYAWLVHIRPPIGPSTMRRTEFLLRVLVGRGAPVSRAMTFAALIDRHIVGSALQDTQEARFHAAHASVHDLAAARGDVPLLTAGLAQPGPGDTDEEFELGLSVLLDGIAHERWEFCRACL